jgi:hypothetical protein
MQTLQSICDWELFLVQSEIVAIATTYQGTMQHVEFTVSEHEQFLVKSEIYTVAYQGTMQHAEYTVYCTQYEREKYVVLVQSEICSCRRKPGNSAACRVYDNSWNYLKSE